MLRATAALALALGLVIGTSAIAAPLAENPFRDDQPGKGEAKPDAPAPADDEAAPEPSPAATEPAPGESAPASTPEGEEEADGQSGTADQESEGGDSGLRGLACLEGDTMGGRRKGVQRRDFLKRHKVELAGVGGFYASDALSSTYNVGGALAFYPSEDFGLELLVTRTPVKFRLEEPFNAFDREQHFQPGAAWQGIVSLLWSPIHAKFKFTEETIIHGDIFAIAGAGRTMHESVLGLTWEMGVGFKLYIWRHVSFRLDIRDFLMPQEVLGRGRITNNVTILAGFSLWLG